MIQKKINILPEFLTNKIAAGEVVQRPESVVKELMENSLDAGAANIDLIIKRAGKDLIQVVDDGEGMCQEDAELSIQRHTTSKISEYKDLEAIRTFGFRGEALSSIAAVSKVEIRTEMRDDDLGTLIRSEDGEIITEKGSYAKGTSIAVKSLFYNTPARRNFLKSNATELKHIIESFKRIALSHPSVSFRLWNDDDLLFDYPGGIITERIRAVFDEKILASLLECEEETEFLSIAGYVAKPSFTRRNKGEQFLFINNRYIQSKTVNHAVFSAYEHILEKGEYPFFILFISLDPAEVDVNVHPSKLEVKFEDEKNIYNFIHAIVKKSLGSHDLVPSMNFGAPRESGSEKLSFSHFRDVTKDDFSDRPAFLNDNKKEKKKRELFSEDDIDMLFGNINRELKESSKENPPESHPFSENKPREIYHKRIEDRVPSTTSQDLPFIISLHNKYILTPIKSGLMIIDQHVAHERILYEQATGALSAEQPFSQQLLFSESVKMDPADYGLLQELNLHLSKLGFEIKYFGNHTIVIAGVPPDIKVGSEVDTLLDILDEYKKNEREKGLEEKDNLAKSYSCKAAIKAGDKLDEKEMRQLVDQLFATSMPYVCPHGRPVVIKIPLEEFDRRFGRTS